MSLDEKRLAELVQVHWPDALFATVSGAHLYGFPSADSDVDLRGSYQLSLDEVIGLRLPAETRARQLDDAGREVDLVGHEIGKYLRLLCKHNGYVLEQIFSPLVVAGKAFLDRLRPLAHRCVTRGCHRHYRGFLHRQIELLEKEEIKKAKTLLYAYRVVLTGIHLLETGAVEAHLPTLNRRFGLPFIDDLIARKQAKEWGGLAELDYPWHRAELARWEQRLDDAAARSTLPEEPARDEAHRFLVDLRLASIPDLGHRPASP
jgi:predicted nucleotidyltransferase